MKPRLLTEKELNTVRGKAMVGHATTDEIMSVFTHYDMIEMMLDEGRRRRLSRY